MNLFFFFFNYDRNSFVEGLLDYGEYCHVDYMSLIKLVNIRKKSRF